MINSIPSTLDRHVGPDDPLDATSINAAFAIKA
jgi:hypothetical protein